ncbi:hypothetical protein BH11PLA2_BH11PLA2_50040 [soil metagenome]
MSDEAKLGLVAGVLAVIGVAAFGMPQGGLSAKAKPETTVTAKNVEAPPSLPPASVGVPTLPVSMSK